MTPPAWERRGIASGGNWIVDRVKTVDRLPGRGMLANIRGNTQSPGGAPANVLADLARLRAPFPLAGYGVIGHDADGAYLAQQFESLGVDVGGLVRSPDAPTSYTDVMNEEGSGERMFFHHRGANAQFGPEHVPVDTLGCRIFHLGYLLLLDRMDSPHPELGIVAAALLKDLRARGILTSVDVVSEDGDRFRQVVPPALRHVDYLIINEIEAGRIVRRPVRRADGTLDGAAVTGAADALLQQGAMQLVAIHMPEGAVLKRRGGRSQSVGSLELPPTFIKGAVGAGDAFCAGLLYGLHEAWDDQDTLRLGCCAAAASLSAAGATDGVGTLADVLALGQRFDWKKPPVTG
ncbi:MAG: carbohydrate kinase family protein [Lentisphaerae bacterium]|nr:carbohydrate kinase family protein [Lentisphaerota bacterium]